MRKCVLAGVAVLALNVTGVGQAAAEGEQWAAAYFERQQQQSERPSRRQAAVSRVDEEDRPQRRGARAQPARGAPPDYSRSSVASSGGQSGVASYYWQPQRVASGGMFNPNAMTAAHKTLPFGTRVLVSRSDGGGSVEVVINDRGPFVAGRVIDLSKAAAQKIGMTGAGLARVNLTVLGR